MLCALKSSSKEVHALQKNLNARSLPYFEYLCVKGGPMVVVGEGCVCEHLCCRDQSVYHATVF